MITVGSRDGRKGVGLGFGGGKEMEETELEEGEACSFSDEDAIMDPDVLYSYIDERLHNVLGHFRKDFEGGVSAETLGAKFGGYGSFLPTYQRSPILSHPKTPAKPHTYNIFESPKSTQPEVDNHSSVITKSAHLAKKGPASTKNVSLSATTALNHESSKRDACMTMTHGVGLNSKSEISKRSAKVPEHKPLKVRIKVGSSSENLSIQNNVAALYSGLGLDVSPSSSFEDSPLEGEELSRAIHDISDESPNSILQVMTSFPFDGGLMLSPLPDDLIHLAKKEPLLRDHRSGPVTKRNHGNGSNSVRGEDTILGQKTKPIENSCTSLKLRNVSNNKGMIKKKETEMDSLACEELVSNTLKLPLMSNSYTEANKVALKDKLFSDTPKEQHCDSIGTVEKNHDSMKAESNFFKGLDPLKLKTDQKAISKEQNSIAQFSEDKPPSSVGKKKSKVSNSHDTLVAKIPKERSVSKAKMGISSETNVSKSGSENLRLQKENGKARDRYNDFFGDIPLENEENEVDSLTFPSKSNVPKVNEKNNFAYNNGPKKRLNGIKTEKSSIVEACPNSASNFANPTGNGPVLNAAPPTDAPVDNNDDWVCCDKCQRWRILPTFVNPNSLPEKWLCSMLDWLPGMNRCNVDEEVTTKAVIALNQAQLLHSQNNLPIGLDRIAPGVTSVDAGYSAQLPAQTSVKSSNLNDEPVYHQLQKSSNSAMELHTNKKRDKNQVLDQYSDGGGSKNSSLKRKRDTYQHSSGDSKKSKKESMPCNNDDDWMPEHGGSIRKARPSSSTGLPTNSTGKDQSNHRQCSSKDSKYDNKNNNFKVSIKNLRDPVRSSLDSKSLDMRKGDNGNIVSNKRKDRGVSDMEEISENSHREEKKPRIPNYDGNNFVARKDQQGRAGPGRGSQNLATTSSSSKVSGSRKSKSNFPEFKGSPVESVSSSPKRNLSNLDKLASGRRNVVEDKDDLRDADLQHGSHGSSALDFQERDFGHLSNSKARAHDSSPQLKNGQICNGNTDNLGHSNVNHYHGSESHSRKSGKGSSSLGSKDKISSSKSEYKKHKNVESLNASQEHTLPYEEKTKSGKSQIQGKCVVDSSKDEKKNASKSSAVKLLAEGGKRDYHPKTGLSQTLNDSEKSPKVSGKTDRLETITGRGRSVPLPPSGLGQNGIHNSTIDASESNGGSSKGLKQTRKAENENGVQQANSRHATPIGQRVNGLEAPSPVKRDNSAHLASSAVKEAKDLKHLADRRKSAGSTHESNGLYLQSALKFLLGASLLESCSSENSKLGDQAMEMYSSTAKLCEFCAQEYERSKDMACAALAYKCMEVSAMRVMYSSHSIAIRDRHELHTALQVVPPGESPSSSASDLDNLNNVVTVVDKVALAKGVLSSPHVAGKHVIPLQTRPVFVRMLNYVQDTNLAMEASRKLQNAFKVANVNLESTQRKECLSSFKKALDFSFHDIEGFIHLVRVAVESINR